MTVIYSFHSHILTNRKRSPMNELKNRIIDILTESDEGLTAKQIAKKLGVERSEVNHILYKYRKFQKDSSRVPIWTLTESFCTITPATFTIEEANESEIDSNDCNETSITDTFSKFGYSYSINDDRLTIALSQRLSKYNIDELSQTGISISEDNLLSIPLSLSNICLVETIRQPNIAARVLRRVRAIFFQSETSCCENCGILFHRDGALCPECQKDAANIIFSYFVEKKNEVLQERKKNEKKKKRLQKNQTVKTESKNKRNSKSKVDTCSPKRVTHKTYSSSNKTNYHSLDYTPLDSYYYRTIVKPEPIQPKEPEYDFKYSLGEFTDSPPMTKHCIYCHNLIREGAVCESCRGQRIKRRRVIHSR